MDNIIKYGIQTLFPKAIFNLIIRNLGYLFKLYLNSQETPSDIHRFLNNK